MTEATKYKLLFATLYPKISVLNDLNELQNTIKFVQEFNTFRKDNPCYSLELLLASCHPETVEVVTAELYRLSDHPKFQVLLCPFDSTQPYHDIRAHEIATGKRLLMRSCANADCDYIYQVDSDMFMSFKHISDSIEQYVKEGIENHFFRFPYSLRDKFEAPVDSGGALLFSKKLYTLYNPSEIMYRLIRRGDKIDILGAEDCNVVRFFREHSKEISPTNIEILHYVSKNAYNLYSNGKITQEQCQESAIKIEHRVEKGCSNCESTKRRMSCKQCACKHLGQARALCLETKKGHSAHDWFVMGHLAEAEDELANEFSDATNKIRDERLKYQEDRAYKIPFEDLITLVDSLKVVA